MDDRSRKLFSRGTVTAVGYSADRDDYPATRSQGFSGFTLLGLPRKRPDARNHILATYSFRSIRDSPCDFFRRTFAFSLGTKAGFHPFDRELFARTDLYSSTGDTVLEVFD